MAIVRIDHRDRGGRRAPDIAAAARAVGDDGPTVALLHGYRYDPATPRRDPHRLLYAETAPPERLNRRGRVASWPEGLGLAGGAGLGLAYGWRARARLAARWRGGAFAEIYHEAETAGAALVDALAAAAAARPAPVDVFAHSLGARVALCALRATAEAGRRDLIARFGRWVLLAPAEFAGTARAALDACAAIGARAPEIYAVHAAHNARYDSLFETFAPRPARNGPPLGRGGLPDAPPCWADLYLDHPDLRRWLALRAMRPPAPPAGSCHWSFYLDPGAMALHRAVLGRAPGFDAESLRGVAPGPCAPGPCAPGPCAPGPCAPGPCAPRPAAPRPSAPLRPAPRPAVAPVGQPA